MIILPPARDTTAHPLTPTSGPLSCGWGVCQSGSPPTRPPSTPHTNTILVGETRTGPMIIWTDPTTAQRYHPSHRVTLLLWSPQPPTRHKPPGPPQTGGTKPHKRAHLVVYLHVLNLDIVKNDAIRENTL
uniref:Uncharacterized protein n=2 Tax=Cacopsylla melanoneura TaxID=428564 RepID=A0A8D8YX44_9HEMI